MNSWVKHAAVSPAKSNWKVQVPKDGRYYFCVQFRYRNGTKAPTDPSTAKSLILAEVCSEKPGTRNRELSRPATRNPTPQSTLKVQADDLRQELIDLQYQVTKQEIARIREKMNELRSNLSKLTDDEARGEILRLMRALEQQEKFLPIE
jgi:hypothetical protein